MVGEDVVHDAGCVDRHMAEPEGSLCICVQGQGRDLGSTASGSIGYRQFVGVTEQFKWTSFQRINEAGYGKIGR